MKTTAFAPWDDVGQRTSPLSPDQLVALQEVTSAPAPSVNAPERVELFGFVDARVEAPRPSVQEDVEPSRVETRLPAPLVMMPPPVGIANPGKLGIVALVVGAVLIGVIALGYRRISALEDELAATKAALETATTRSPTQ